MTLGELCEIARGGSPRPIKEFQTDDPNGIPWIKISDATASSKYIYKTKEKIRPEGIKRSRLVKEGDFLLSNSMSFGRPYIMRTSGCIHDGWLVLSDKTSLFDQDYLYHFLSSANAYRQFDSLAAGSTVRNLNIDLVKGVKVPLPPLSEQKRIVTILDEAFAGVATAVANTEKNLANARELFESYLNNVFTQKGKGWEEKTLGDVCVLKSGTTVRKDIERSSGEVPYLKVADMNRAKNEIEIVGSSRFLNKSDIGRNAIFPVGTTIFPKRGGAILTNKKRLTAVPLCADLNIMGVIPSDALAPEFLYFYFLNVDMKKLGSGSSIPQINNYDIEPLAISFPQVIAEQKEVAKTLEEILSETQRLESVYQHKLTTLAELKQSILHKAFSGELIAQPERVLQEAVA